MSAVDEQCNIKAPYLIFLGDAPDELIGKTGAGIAEWRRRDCVGQLRLPGCGVDLGLPDLSPTAAAKAGAKTIVIGIAPPGGNLPPTWIPLLLKALEAGLDVASGLHTRLNEIPELVETARRHECRLFDVRHPPRTFTVGKGIKRSGKRLLTVGTDCAVGKKYAALAIHAEFERRGLPATFRATGQTGILIGGGGVAVDAIVGDFISGAAEWLSPAADPAHWDIIEGQGSLYHPSYAAVTVGLLHGSQPDAFVVCHEPTRRTLRGVAVPIPSIEEIIDLTVRLGRLTNPAIRCTGICINTAKLDEAAARDLIAATELHHRLPTTDPIRFGTASIVEALL